MSYVTVQHAVLVLAFFNFFTTALGLLESNRVDPGKELASLAVESPPHRVFVGGLASTIESHTLQSHLEHQYGPVAKVVIHRERSARPYAFVDFVNPKDADRAIDRSESMHYNEKKDSSQFLYSQIRPATRIDTSKRTKSARRKQKSQTDFQRKQKIALESDLLVQVEASHLQRVQEFLEPHGFLSTGSYSTASSLAMLGLKTNQVGNSLSAFLEHLDPAIPIRKVAVRKWYQVDPRKVVQPPETSSSEHQGLKQCVHILKTMDPTSRVRLDVFPASLRMQIIDYLRHNYPDLLSMLSPKEYDETLGVVQIPTDLGSIWCIGTQMKKEASCDPKINRGLRSQTQAQHLRICRAHDKLQEAFVRYFDGKTTLSHIPSFSDAIAVDCGAAPGGWTQFLAENDFGLQCKFIFSIDPGEMDREVVAHASVEHLKCKVEIAMEQLVRTLSDRKLSKVDIWVSDMCLHDMGQQIDWLLKARACGNVAEGTFFVLTMKCNRGHSAASFDLQVEGQVKRLGGYARDVQTMHLFTNRSGERTIAGYLT